jgi:hypothetical protein
MQDQGRGRAEQTISTLKLLNLWAFGFFVLAIVAIATNLSVSGRSVWEISLCAGLAAAVLARVVGDH